MKDSPCDVTKGVSKRLNNNSELFNVNELEVINKTFKKIILGYRLQQLER